ncbi:MAG: hypothetical protein ABS95_02340 [Verrucomicrobia bacterium SCN 57-15]|nr:MAG: hypothetical protein ABS95_02340 [Verrucomicrobia bacterium SCN 57-15]
MLSTVEQIEFTNLPPRNAPRPVEDARELEHILHRLMQPLTPAQRMETCQQLISAAMHGEEMHVLNQPLRVHIGQLNSAFRRTIKLAGESIVHAILSALVSTAHCSD